MHKNALGWTIADIKGISPLICTHKIYLEENAKPSREMQRRLNPNMKEYVPKGEFFSCQQSSPTTLDRNMTIAVKLDGCTFYAKIRI